MPNGTTIVIDLGKTLSKVSLWDLDGQMLDRQVRPNAPIEVDGVRRLDAGGTAQWLLETLARYAAHPVRTIVPVGHGAAICALDQGRLAFAPLDYEEELPGDLLDEYRAARDPFSVTGSPALSGGLNLGAQLFWMERIYPQVMARATLVPWAQYWAFFLTGRAVSEVTSLGCHSDLWNPLANDFSPLAKRMGWAEKLKPVVRASDVVGTLTADIATATGLSPDVRVLAGLHDSNAALLAARGFAEIADNEATVLSTGTWFIAMRTPRTAPEPAAHAALLPEARDCLVNVDAHGSPVPSARLMGGREIEALIEIDTRRVDIKPDQPALLAAVPQVLRHNRMILPTLCGGCGPYPKATFTWINRPDDWYERRALACLYAALVADTSLDLIGASERLLVEGRFAEAEVFVRALAALRPDCQVFTANAHNDVSFGALRLIDPGLKPQGDLVRVQPLDADLDTYRRRWLAEVEATNVSNAA
ncbi:FGGY-family carbohydrate kinase [Novosphingobium huizhouense]|uniref:FGGY-family carbohydrate kinase n=1 Tax=Novosphingobium huizhouense TaxID=2866625 RepID=UPI001CD8C425|nr:FGGY family carbohydrate kinase [Novosphingobium huizhouense]